MVTEWQRRELDRVHREKLKREGAYQKLDDHRDDCEQCKGKSVDQIMRGRCWGGADLAAKLQIANRNVKEPKK